MITGAKGATTKQGLVQIKNAGTASKSNRGYSLTNRQRSTKQMGGVQQNSLYSQISLKEMQSPVKQLKLASKVKLGGGPNFYGQVQGTQGKGSKQQMNVGLA